MTPPPRFGRSLDAVEERTSARFVRTPVHGPALDTLLADLTAPAGSGAAPALLLTTGAPGTGKTALCRALYDRLIATRDLAVGLIADAATERGDVRLLRDIIAALGTSPSGRTGIDLLAEGHALVAALAGEGRRAVLLIDNAQALSGSQLETLRSLLDHSAALPDDGPSTTGLTLALFGAPELRDRIARRRGLVGRLTTTVALAPLDRDALATLLDGHDADGGPRLGATALDAIAVASAGIPARALPLAAAARRAALARGWEEVDERLVAALALARADGASEPRSAATQTTLPLDAPNGALPHVPPAQLTLLGGEEGGE